MEVRPVVVVAYDGAELVDISCVTSALDTANRVGAIPPYEVRLASPGGRVIHCDSGLQVRAQARVEDQFELIDTLVVSGGLGHEAAAEDSRFLRHVRRLAAQSRRVASVCTGATVLAAAGLLAGRSATTHWMYARRLADNYPKVSVDAGPIFIRDGSVSTSGGVTAALDLTLAFIEEDHGSELARWVALGMVTYLQRPGNRAQMSMFTTARRPDDVLIRKVLDHVAANLDSDLSTTETVRRIRLEVAARLLSTSDLPLSQVARRCGFSSAETLRQAFAGRYGIAPSRSRSAHSATTAPRMALSAQSAT